MSKIDELITRVKERQKEENKDEIDKQRGLDFRRKEAIHRIAEAGIRLLDLDNDIDARTSVENRMLDAEKGRLSRAEALADLAERGDFVSDPWWWDIKEQSEGSKVSIWRGYVKYHRIVRKKKRSADDFIDLNVREKVKGGYVAEVLGNHGVSAAVDDNSPRKAAMKAYNGYMSKVNHFPVNLLPVDLDFDDKDVCKVDDSRSPINFFDSECDNGIG
ncbi:hypothetical protein E2P64_07565 [Candidatus Bathyarchaeota archaeon]|nr:hypothetical protein E2P64_07565 [Candidatus Bathyarchaeota archaeon]